MYIILPQFQERGNGEISYLSDIWDRRHTFRQTLSLITHLRAHETVLDLVCRLLLEKKKNKKKIGVNNKK